METVSLRIGPLNTASQPHAWASAVSNELGVSAQTIGYDGPVSNLLANTVNDRSDIHLSHPRITPRWLRASGVRRAMKNATHYLNESNVALIENRRKGCFTDEVAYFHSLGIQCGIVFHGSDIRDPDIVMEQNEHAFFHDTPAEFVDRLRDVSHKNREAALGSGLPIFVSTPDLLQHVSGSKLLPLTVDQKIWACTPPAFTNGVPTVLHRPAANNVLTKGTNHIMPVLEELEDLGLIRVMRPEVVPHSQMPAIFSRADIVIDQLGLDTYGVTAIEAMASSRLVIAAIGSSTTSYFGENLPIVNASPSSFRAVLLDLLKDKERMKHLASAGHKFVARWHNGMAATRSLNSFLTN